MLNLPNSQQLLDWIESNPAVSDFTVVLCDLNGVYRGKRLPITSAKKAVEGGLKLPLSTLFLDIWGRDTIGSGQVLETGDRDGVLVPTVRGFLPTRWQSRDSALLPVTMYDVDGTPFAGDPRNALSRVVARYRKRGLSPVCAAELEFYLYEPRKSGEGIAPPALPDGTRRLSENAIYSVGNLDHFNQVFDDIYAACEAMDVRAESAISEGGCGQFEVNLSHRNDAVMAADDAQMFKHIVKSIAKRHALAATFMAKPYGNEAGNGFHTHFSILNEEGANVFANGSAEGSNALRHAVGGLLNALPASMLVFAPHSNSYRRLRDGSHAPTNASWGYDNRTAAIRIPSGPDASRRIEHRVAGADANPYLVFTSILGSALTGIESNTAPNEPTQQNAYASGRSSLPSTWHEAVSLFSSSDHIRDLFGDYLVDVFTACKRQEMDSFAAIVPQAEYEAYLEVV